MINLDLTQLFKIESSFKKNQYKQLCQQYKKHHMIILNGTKILLNKIQSLLIKALSKLVIEL